MPLFSIGKSLDDIESHRYDNWGSMSGSGLRGSVENSLSRSQRCFQVENAGETNGNQNFYSTTGNLTPGPGSYEVDHSDPQVGPYSPTFSFGNSTKNRTLSESNRLWASSDNSTPSPNAYNINKPSTQDYLKDLLGVSKWKLKKSKRKLRTTEKLTKFETRTLTDEISLLEKRIKAINRELSLTPPPVSPIKKHKNPFVMTELKPHQKDIKIDNAPTFYMNEETDWDFGARNRGLNVPDMNSFGYSKKFVEEKELEEQTQADVITGSSRPRSRCRNTDFFGPNKDFRNEVPAVGSYTPDLVPSNYLYGMTGTIKGGNHDDNFSRNGTLSTHSSWNTMSKGHKGSLTFNFNRSASMKTPLSATLPSQVAHPRVVYAATHKHRNSIGHGNVNTTDTNAKTNAMMHTTPRAKSRQKGTQSRRNSNCSELTLDSPLPSPVKGGGEEGAQQSLFKSMVTPIKKN